MTNPTNSFVNNFFANNFNYPAPEVGMGVTRLGWTDRYPGTIVEVINPKTVIVQADSYKRIDKNGMSECQNYEFAPDFSAPREVVTLRKNGRWVTKGEPMTNGTTWVIGRREKYHDFSF